MSDAGSDGGAAPPQGATYRAFLSYSHRDKAAVAKLHRMLETFRVPAQLVGRETPIGPAPRRLTPIFRDRDELPASDDLGARLTDALRRSMFLVVICSPASARSTYVREEILQFKRLHGEGRVLALIVDGEPNAADMPGREDEECFPVPLKFRIGPDGELSSVRAEPIAADVRPHADGWRLGEMKLIAGLTGLGLDDLVQRETQRRIQSLAAIATAATAGMILTCGLAVYANTKRLEAERQRTIAERESAAARAASDYLISTFELANPATENPETITALTILDRSAERARRELKSQPAIQARLLSTLGVAYNNLGLFDAAQKALEPSIGDMRKAGAEGVAPLLTLAITYTDQGDVERALATVASAEAALKGDEPETLELRARAAVVKGRAYAARTELAKAIVEYDRGLALYGRLPRPPHDRIAVLTENRGLLLIDEGRHDEAETALQSSLATYLRLYGQNHVRVGSAWNALAYNALMRQRYEEAERRIATAIRIRSAVLDAKNPSLADSYSLQGQIQQATGRLADAERSLQRAVAIYRNAYGRPHANIGIAEVFLGLIQSERAQTAAALATLADAKRNYDVGYGGLHPNHGDLLVHRAIVLARAGRMREARADCAEGLKILGETLGADAAYTRTMTETCRGLKPGMSTRA